MGMAAQQQQQQAGGGYSQTPEFFLSNYRLGKTLGIGSFGKAGRPRCRLEAVSAPRVYACPSLDRRACPACCAWCHVRRSALGEHAKLGRAPWSQLHGPGAQVKVAEHVLTSHKVAIKILNRKKIKQMDMEEKGAAPSPTPGSFRGATNICACLKGASGQLFPAGSA